MSEATTQALVGTILALLIAFSLFPSCQRYFETNKSEGFTDLNNKINEMLSANPVETKNAVQVRVKEDTFIVGFTKDAQKMSIDYKGGGTYIIKRPDNCAQGKACICYCNQAEDEHTCKDNKYGCESQSINFPDTIKGTDFFQDVASFKELRDEIVSYTGGFYLFYDFNGVETLQPLPLTLKYKTDAFYVTMNPDFPVD